MGIETILMMIPKGGKYATSVVNKVYNLPNNWVKFKSAVQQIERLLKGGKLKLDGKQKTNYEANKNILKNYEKVTKDAYTQYEKATKDKKDFIDKSAQITDDLFKGKVTKDTADLFKGWTPTLVERSSLRNVYKKLEPHPSKYTKEMEAIDEELDALAFGGEKYEGLSTAAKAKIFQKLQAEMKKLIDIAKKEDLSTLSLGELNKKSHNIQKRIREIANNPNIKGTVNEGPKHDMIKAIYDSESKVISNARDTIKLKNIEKKYGTKFPRLDPENDSFIILGLDETGGPIKMSRFIGKFSAERHPITADLTRKEGTQWWDKWDVKKNKMREEGKEVWHNTTDNEGKVIMSNPDYKLSKTGNMELQNEFYTNLSTSDLAKKGYTLKQVDMIRKGREAKKYLEKTKHKDHNIAMHEQTSSSEIGAVIEDLYHRGDDVYKMTMEEWIKKLPEYFAGGGRVAYGEGTGGISNFFKKKLHKFTKEGQEELTKDWLEEKGMDLTVKEWREKPFKERLYIWLWRAQMWNPEMEKGVDYAEGGSTGFATGGVSNLFRQRQGYRDAGSVIKLAKGARWLIRMLKEMSDDMLFGRAQFTNMVESMKMKYFKETQAAIKHLEAGHPIPPELLKTMRADKRFQNLTVSKTGDKDFIEMQEVVLGKTNVEKTTAEKLLEKKDDIIKHMTHDFKGKPYKDVVQPVKGKGVEHEYLEKGIAEGAAEQIENLKAIKRAKIIAEKNLKGLEQQTGVTIDLIAFKKTLPKDLLDRVNALPVEDQTPLLLKFKEASDAVKKGGVEGGIEVLQKDLLETFIPKGKPNAEGGLIGYATGGVSNLFRRR